jgi:CRP-like cAMP-binding protein
MDVYAGLSVFNGLTAEQLRSLDTLLVHCRFPQGFTIFEQGQPAANLFIVTEGEIVISYKPYDGPSLTVARIQPGGVFGWSAALRRDIYTSSAQASNDSSALCISSSGLQRFCEQQPDTAAAFLDRLASVIAARLNNTHTEILSILTRGMDLSDNCTRRTKTHE